MTLLHAVSAVSNPPSWAPHLNASRKRRSTTSIHNKSHTQQPQRRQQGTSSKLTLESLCTRSTFSKLRTSHSGTRLFEGQTRRTGNCARMPSSESAVVQMTNSATVDTVCTLVNNPRSYKQNESWAPVMIVAILTFKTPLR